MNGQVVTELGTRVDPKADVVEVDREEVRIAPPVWIALHKPRGYVSTRRDPQGRPTLYDLLPEESADLFHVGRLDVDSEGLVLLTNHGDLANRLLHPRYGVERVYRVEVEGRISEADVRRLLSGVELEDGVARPESVTRLRPPGPGRSRLHLTLREGRKREVRRLFDKLSHPVLRLVRVRFGPVSLGRLSPGSWRALTPAEIRAISKIGAARRA